MSQDEQHGFSFQMDSVLRLIVKRSVQAANVKINFCHRSSIYFETLRFGLQLPVIVSGWRVVSSRQVSGREPSSRRTIEMQPGEGQTR
jgi:hypothetical protein